MEGTTKSARGPGGDFLRTTLQQIPTIFGRLVYLSSLRDRTSGVYEHERLAGLFGPEDADRALRHRHRLIFAEWLGHNLEDQKNDLEEFLTAKLAAGETVTNPALAAVYRDVIPPSASEVEKTLYLSDLETLLGLLVADRAAASWNPGA